MRYSYALLSIGFVICIGALWFVDIHTKTQHMLTLSSPAFTEGGTIPAKYTCDGSQLSPELHISGIPEGTRQLVIVMDDPDVPKALKPDGMFDHWVMYGIDPTTTVIPEGTTVGAAGLNGAGTAGYTGPCPPPEYQPTEHTYHFRVYAVSTTLNFIKTPTKSEVLSAIQNNIIESAALIGRYDRAKK